MDESSGTPTRRGFLRRLMIAVGVVGLVATLAAIFTLAWSGILTILGGVLMGVLLDGVASRIARWTHMPRGLALAFVCLLAIGAIVGLGFWLGPAIAEQVTSVRDQVSAAWHDFMAWMRARPWGPEVLERLSQVKLSTLLKPAFGGWLSTTAGIFGSLVLMVVFGVYLGADPELYMRGAAYLLPPHQRPRALQLMREIGRALRSWLVGRFISMGIVGTGTALGLWAVGVPLAVPLGVIAALLSFVPNVGPILAALPGILLGFTAGTQVASYALAVYVAVQLVESYLLTPVIQQKLVSLPPALLLSFQLLMSFSAGVIGLFMATPILVVIVVIVQALYLRGLFHDDVTLIGEPDEGHSHPVRRRLARWFRARKSSSKSR